MFVQPRGTAPTNVNGAQPAPTATPPIRRPRPSGLVAAVATGLAVLAAVLLRTGIPVPVPPGGTDVAPFNGGVLTPARELPEFALQRADGQPFTLASTRGRVSLFFFGYTFCPDVCPLTLAQVAQIRRGLGPSADRVDAYFVTVDPERDTPERLAAYVARFDPSIVALTSTQAELQPALAAFAAIAEKRPAPDSAGFYFMDHTASVYLVDPERRLRLIYPYGSTAPEVVADVRHILADSPAQPATSGASRPEQQSAATAAALSIEGAWARPAAVGETSAVYLVVRNQSDKEDRLVGARSEAAGAAELHRGSVDSGVARMHSHGEAVVPAGGTLALQPGGSHLMLIGLRRDLREGSELTITLQFERAGEVQVVVPVRSGS